MLDTVIQNANVFDGDGTEPRRLTVGIRGDRIAYVGDDLTAAAEHRIDAGGLFLCPGFIDTHASTGLGYTLPRAGDNKLFQGVTTEVIGNCGTSTGPIGPSLAGRHHPPARPRRCIMRSVRKTYSRPWQESDRFENG